MARLTEAGVHPAQRAVVAEEARAIIERFVDEYNHVRLHSAIGYVTPADKLTGREQEIFAERDRKLEAARERRRLARQVA